MAKKGAVGCDSAIDSVHRYIFPTRAYMARIVDEVLFHSDPDKSADPFRYERDQMGLVGLKLARKVKHAELAAAHNMGKRDLEAMADWGEGFKPKISNEESSRVAAGKVSLFSHTQKMGCYSFNMPAGPTGMSITGEAIGGTCPSSSMWFPLVVKGKSLIKRSASYKNVKIDVRTGICAGCYGLKGNYGRPSLMFFMECRRRWIDWHLKNPQRRALLVKRLHEAVRWSQISATILRMASDPADWDKLPHPGYFRIHDVGDFYKRELLDVWIDVARKCSRPEMWNGFQMPMVKFWAPTRVWMIAGILDRTVAKKMPGNFILRPSAGHFGERSPELSEVGYAAGSTSTDVDPDLTQQTLQNAAMVVGEVRSAKKGARGKGWICPAYVSPDKGGGTIWSEKKKEWVGGTCNRSIGPGGVDREPGNVGCRACWEQRGLAVVYPCH
jgi:hypothetical protein